MGHVMVVFGTRPEAIKLAPVIGAMSGSPGLRTTVLVSAQHREMLDQVLSFFSIRPDIDLDLMRPDQALPDLFGRVLNGVHAAIKKASPDLVMVHGDTSTTLAAALAGFYARVPVAHVEAGLRTHDMSAPWPEEMNRRLTAPLANLHFAPTRQAERNLLKEGIPASDIHVTGNTAVDAVLQTAARIDGDPALREQLDAQLPAITKGSKVVLVTSHRRENFGKRFERICLSLRNLAADGIHIVYPVHPNPNIRVPAQRLLGGLAGIDLIEPLEYLPFVRLMQRADIILTDSGGIQEEAPSLDKPVLLMRDTTERPEAVEAGCVKLVGTEPTRIVRAVTRLLESPIEYGQMASARNPYGDGAASVRVTDIVRRMIHP